VVDILEDDITPVFRVLLSSVDAAKIRDGMPRASAAEHAGLETPYGSQLEAGGLMMGEQVGDNTFRITDISLTTGQPHSFHLDPLVHQPFLDAFYARFPDRWRFNLIGSWHSHPSGNLTPSPCDLESLKETMATPSFEAPFMVMLIVGLGADDQLNAEGVVLIREPKVLSRIEVSIEHDQTASGLGAE
jgi:proteasome lid subunit RPN8/RPN11